MITTSGVDEELNEIQFEFVIPDVVPGDVLAFHFVRDSTDAADTYTGAIDIALIEAVGFFWR